MLPKEIKEESFYEFVHYLWYSSQPFIKVIHRLDLLLIAYPLKLELGRPEVIKEIGFLEEETEYDWMKRSCELPGGIKWPTFCKKVKNYYGCFLKQEEKWIFSHNLFALMSFYNHKPFFCLIYTLDLILIEPLCKASLSALEAVKNSFVVYRCRALTVQRRSDPRLTLLWVPLLAREDQSYSKGI